MSEKPATNPAQLDAALRRLGLLEPAATARWTPLTGGVSSDIWRVELADRTVCVKRARPVLAVAAQWHAPVERNESEVGWLELAQKICPGAAPRVIGHLPDLHLFVMEYLEPAQHPVWKHELAAGRVDATFAAQVGTVLGKLHAGTANNAAIAERFATDALFHALRIEPYLDATAQAHADLAPQLEGLAARTVGNRIALVHGDVSPKNLLVGPSGPMFLDAECAWYGDPAFDVAFCLTHLLLKCMWIRTQRVALLHSFDALTAAYTERVTWEPVDQLESRVATLLPALLLARIDGKSPVEYLTDEADRDFVRTVARDLLARREPQLGAVRDTWKGSFSP